MLDGCAQRDAVEAEPSARLRPSAHARASIPPTCHFVWLGPEFPFLNPHAVVSAVVRGGFERVCLHADHDLSQTPFFSALQRHRAFEFRRIDLDGLAASAGASPRRVRALFDNMTSQAARSDVLRVLALASQGGVYLDIDTVTVGSFDRLRASSAFVGQEYICFPEWSTRRPSVAERTRAYALAVLRLALRSAPRGYRGFSKVARWYALAVNNAVLGTAPGHTFIATYLEAMLAADPSHARRRFAIGPDMLAHVCRDPKVEGVAILEPECFYPMAPVISGQWWSLQDAPNLSEVIAPNTVSVHWYASAQSRRLAERVNPEYLRANRHRQLFASLASPFLEYF
jgi:hypothetical protein